MKKLNKKQINELYDQGPEAVGNVVNNLIDKINHQQKIIEKQQLLIEAQRKEINQLKARVKKLEEQVNKNSKNSSKPPSSDGYKKPKSHRKKTSKNNGGQKNHKGKTLKQVDNPDEVVKHEASVCEECGHSLNDIESSKHEKRQVFDIEINVVVTEHQAEEKTCPHCGNHNKANFPADVKGPVQYGSNFKSIASYLNLYQLLPLERTCEFFEDVFQLRPSEATIINSNNIIYDNLEILEEEIKQCIINEPVVNFDETGTSVKGKTKWLHSASTEDLTYFSIHQKRGKKGMDDINILPNFKGVAVHDFWNSYTKFEDCNHQFCNAHLLRELRGIYENDERQKWALELLLLLCEIKYTVDETKENTDRNSLTALQIEFFKDIYQQLLDKGFKLNAKLDAGKYPENKRGRKKQSKGKNLLDRFEEYQDDVLRFMSNFDVPFDNNLAERDIRMTKVKEKISGTFRSIKGANIFTRVRGYISTARKNKQSILTAIKNAIKNKPYRPEKLDTS
jgi:transposase/uncharacterized coiled-coil protein SlyX